MTEIAYSADETASNYQQTQGNLQAAKAGIPAHDSRGIDDPAISAALDKHNEKTKSNMDAAHDTLDVGKDATKTMRAKDVEDSAKARRLDPGAAAIRDALSKPMGSAAPTAGGAPMPAPMAAAPVPAPMPSMPQMPVYQPGMLNLSPEAFAKLLEGAGFTPDDLTGDSVSSKGQAPLDANGVDLTRSNAGVLTNPGEYPPIRLLTKSQLNAVIDQALDNNGVSRDPQVRARWTSLLQTMAMHESSGNPNAVNKSDSNAIGAIQADDAPAQSSRGLWQTIPTTFAAHHVAGTSNSIYDPVANGSAAVAYMMSRYKLGAGGEGVEAFHARRTAGGSYSGF